MAALLLCSKSHDSADAPLTNRRAPGPQPLVLVVEDHEDTRFMLRTVLEMRSLNVVEARNGEEAIDTAERTRPDLVLMDSGLPRLDGISATRRLRQLASLGGVPIVFLSGHAGADFQRLALAAGCNEYLVKPVEIDQLDRILDQYIFQQRIGGSVEAV